MFRGRNGGVTQESQQYDLSFPSLPSSPLLLSWAGMFLSCMYTSNPYSLVMSLIVHSPQSKPATTEAGGQKCPEPNGRIFSTLLEKNLNLKFDGLDLSPIFTVFTAWCLQENHFFLCISLLSNANDRRALSCCNYQTHMESWHFPKSNLKTFLISEYNQLPCQKSRSMWAAWLVMPQERAKEKLSYSYGTEPTKPLPDTTWMRLNTVARDSVHSSTKLKKSRSTWKGVQQIANTRTKTTGKGSGKRKDGVGQASMWCPFPPVSFFFFFIKVSQLPWLSDDCNRQMGSQR